MGMPFGESGGYRGSAGAEALGARQSKEGKKRFSSFRSNFPDPSLPTQPISGAAKVLSAAFRPASLSGFPAENGKENDLSRASNTSHHPAE